jgi:hypothetical protein
VAYAPRWGASLRPQGTRTYTTRSRGLCPLFIFPLVLNLV